MNQSFGDAFLPLKVHDRDLHVTYISGPMNQRNQRNSEYFLLLSDCFGLLDTSLIPGSYIACLKKRGAYYSLR